MKTKNIIILASLGLLGWYIFKKMKPTQIVNNSLQPKQDLLNNNRIDSILNQMTPEKKASTTQGVDYVRKSAKPTKGYNEYNVKPVNVVLSDLKQGIVCPEGYMVSYAPDSGGMGIVPTCVPIQNVNIAKDVSMGRETTDIIFNLPERRAAEY